LSIAEVSLLVLFGTLIVIVIPIIVWLFRDLRRIGPAQPASKAKEEDAATNPLDHSRRDHILDQQNRAVSPARDGEREAKASPPS
jgi:hypothetical protein